MSARIILTDLDGDRHIQEYESIAYARKAMHFMSGVIGRALRTDKPQILGIGREKVGESHEPWPEFSIRTDHVKSLRLVEDEDDIPTDEDEDEAKIDPDWWKK